MHCNGCDKTLEKRQFYFQEVKLPVCKPCYIKQTGRKRCPKCKTEKEVAHFKKCKAPSVDGRDAVCNECREKDRINRQVIRNWKRYEDINSAFRGVDNVDERRDLLISAKLLVLPWNREGLEEAKKNAEGIYETGQ